jgi:hypothetical protein
MDGLPFSGCGVSAESVRSVARALRYGAEVNEFTFAAKPTGRSSDRYLDDAAGRSSYRSILSIDE